MSDTQQTPKKNSTNGTNNGSGARRALMLVIVAIVVGTLWFASQSGNNAKKSLDNAEKAQKTADSGAKVDEYKGWKSYTWAAQGVSFKHPGDWFVSENADMGRLYVKNSQVDLLKEETPENFQQFWLSVDNDENSAAREAAIKAGTSMYREVSGSVKASTVKTGDLTINVYEYETVGGPTLEAYWTSKTGKRFFATTSTEVGKQNQTDMVATLKKALASVAFIQ